MNIQAWKIMLFIKTIQYTFIKTRQDQNFRNKVGVNKVRKESYLIRQYKIQISNKIFFFKYRKRKLIATETNK